jgi:hypothetical protein
MQQIFTTKVQTNLDGVLQTTQMIDGIMMTGDNAANQILVELYDGIDRIDIAQDTKIVGYFIRSDGFTLEVDGNVIQEDGDEYHSIQVVIPEAAYQVSGNLSIAIRIFRDPESKTVVTRQYAVVTTVRKYQKIETTRKYLNIIIDRRYYNSETGEWVILEDGEEVPDGAVVEETQSSEWVKLEDGEEAPAGAEIEETVNYVTVILEDGIEPPVGVEVETVEIKNWVTLGDNEEPPPGAEVQSTSTNVVTWGTKIVVATLNCYVKITETNSIIDVYHHIPDVQELLEYIELLDQKQLIVDENEAARVAAERSRVSAEGQRVLNESERVQNELDRISAEEGRSGAEEQRVSNEDERYQAEEQRVQNEQERVQNESDRVDAELNREAKINGMTVEAQDLPPFSTPTATISEVNGHKHIIFGLRPGDPFVIRRTFNSVEEMNSYSGTDVETGQFVIIASNVNDPHNAEMYVKTTNGYSFVTDLSGAQGIQGPTGLTGNGISSAVLNADYTLTLNFTDGTSYTSSSIRGAKGDTGVSIASVVLNPDYTITINFSDNTSYTTSESVRGPQGATGETGKGIDYVEQNTENYRLIIHFTDGTTYTTEPMKGETGDAGTFFDYNSENNTLEISFY